MTLVKKVKMFFSEILLDLVFRNGWSVWIEENCIEKPPKTSALNIQTQTPVTDFSLQEVFLQKYRDLLIAWQRGKWRYPLKTRQITSTYLGNGMGQLPPFWGHFCKLVTRTFYVRTQKYPEVFCEVSRSQYFCFQSDFSFFP